jgi:type IV pilus assembly protein PilO
MDKYLDQIAKAAPAVKYGGLAAAVIALTALNFFLVISPVEDTITKQISKQRQLDLQLSEKQEIAQNLNERRREMDVLEQKLAEALTELPEQKDMDELLSQLNDIGKKSGLEISKVEPAGESRDAFFARIPVRMNVTGNYNEIAMFLQEVSTMRRIVNVNGIKLGSPSMRNEKVVLHSSFVATTFRFVDKPAPKAKPKGKKR